MPDRYCVPTSFPCRIPCVGSWFSQNTAADPRSEPSRIVHDEDDLVVAGQAGAHFTIRRVRRVAGRVTDAVV